MPNKGKVVVIITCTVLLTGNILGLYWDFNGLNQWNLNKLLIYFAKYYSFSFAKWYEFEGLMQFKNHPGSLYSDLLIVDFILLILGLITSIFFYSTKSGRLFLICLFITVIILGLIVTLREYKFLNSVTRDYIPSSWDTNIKKDWYLKCTIPRSIYILLTSLSLYMLFIQLKKPKTTLE